MIRNSDETFLAVSTIFLQNVASTATAEAMAMREGLVLANRLGCNGVIIESDSMEIVVSCSGEEIWWGESSGMHFC
jgi:ribonuclease HI